MSKPVVVIVPGSWHQPQHYRRLTDELTSSGYEALTVARPSLNSQPPHASWDQDAEAVRQVILGYLEDGKEVLMIGHSFGGVAMSEAAKGLGKRVREEQGLKGGVVRLMYMCAMALPEGQTFIGQMKPATAEEEVEHQRREELAKQMQAIRYEDGGAMVLNKEIIGQVFYNGCDPKDVAEAVELLGTSPSGPLSVPATYTAYREIASTYIVCENDQALPLSVQERMVAQGEGVFDVERCQEGHSPFMSNARFIVECVERAVAATA